MNKETRNIVIGVIVALVVGYSVGSASQTGRCPITGIVVCKERAAACDKMKACATECEAKEAAPKAETAK